MEIRIKIPEELKSYIVDDWAQICRRKRLAILPARSPSTKERLNIVTRSTFRTTADQLISEYTRTKTMNKAEKLKNNREKAILEVDANSVKSFRIKSTQLSTLIR